MGYYHVRIRTDVSNLCELILPWGKYKYKILTMEVFNFPDISQGGNEQNIPIFWMHTCVSQLSISLDKR